MSVSKYVRGIVTARHSVTPELWTMRVRPDEKLVFLPGQYVAVGLEYGSRMIERPYSLASSSHEEELEFFLELVPSGQLTPHLYKLGKGDSLWLRRAAKGRFRFDSSSGRINHLMVATVTGVAPFVSMIRHHLAGPELPGNVFLLHGASVSSELGYDGELSGYANHRRWFRYVPTVSRGHLDADWQGEHGRVEDVVRKYTDGLGFTAANTTAYLCGNPHMIERVRAVLERAGWPPDFIQEEGFWPVRIPEPPQPR